jgi:hypothetical protein
VLTTTSLPWIGSPFRARATGMPATAFVFSLLGLSPVAVPLAPLLPQALPGCDLLVALDILGGALPAGGVVSTEFALADTTSLVGVVCHHQVVPFELDAVGNVVAITASNALLLTIGAL